MNVNARTGSRVRRVRVRVAGPLYAILLAACAAGSSETGTGAISTGNVRVQNSLGGSAGVDLTTQAAVMDSVLPAAVATVWRVLPSVFDTLEVDTPIADVRRLTMGNDRFRAPSRIAGQRLSTYLDCGVSFGRPNADRYEVVLQLAVELRPVTPTSTAVSTLVDAYASSRDVRGNALHCRSKGTLERLMFALMAERLPTG